MILTLARLATNQNYIVNGHDDEWTDGDNTFSSRVDFLIKEERRLLREADCSAELDSGFLLLHIRYEESSFIPLNTNIFNTCCIAAFSWFAYI